jgi:tetratricopeptide (TPR) repeat protein
MQVWQELALAFAAQGALADAFFCSDQSQQLLPWAASTHYVLGCVLEAAGRVEEATNSYNTALALDTCHAPSLLRLGGRRAGAAPGTVWMCVALEYQRPGVHFTDGRALR